jgi:subtilisin family serine protease
MLTIRNLHLLLFYFLIISCSSGDDDNPVTSSSSPASTSSDSKSCDSVCQSYQTTEYYNQKGLDIIYAAQAYSYLSQNGLNIAGDGVNVAIVDTGTYGPHEDLSSNYNFTDSVADGSNYDESGHGTHVAGIASGMKTNSDSSMHGVAFNSSIIGIAYNGISGVNSGTDNFDNTVINSGSTVVNMSFGGTTSISSTNNQLLDILADSSIGARSVLVAATGNNRYSYDYSTGIDSWDSTSDNPFYPAANASDANIKGQMLAVAALNTSSYFLDITFSGDDISAIAYNTLSGDIDHTIAFYSNYCGSASRYCLAAPGGDKHDYVGDSNNYKIFSSYYDINSPSITNSYESLSGTSMAAPHVSGAAAILQSAWPSLTGKEVTQILLETADYLSCSDLLLPSKASCSETTITGDTGTYTYNNVSGWGSLNLSAAVRANGSSDILSGYNLDGPSYDLDMTNLSVSSSFANKLINSKIFSQAVFFDIYNRNYKANLSDKILIRNSSRQTVNFDAGNYYKNFNIGNKLNMGFVDQSQISDFVLLGFYDDEYANYSLDNLGYKVSWNNYDLNFYFSSGYQSYKTNGKNQNMTDEIYNFNQEDRAGIQISSNFLGDYIYEIGFYNDNNDIHELHNSLKIDKANLDIDLIYSFINSGDNLIGITGSEAFLLGDSNVQHIFGFNVVKDLAQDLNFFMEYRHLIGDESNNDQGILRNFRDIEENSISFGFDKQYLNNNFHLSIFIPPAIIKGLVDLDVAVARNSNIVVRAQDTINLSEADREIDYNFSWSKYSQKGAISLTYTYKENFEHNNHDQDQLLFISYRLVIN